MKIVKATAVIGLLLLTPAAWFFIASDYTDHVAVGTYHFAMKDESSTLTLAADHTFQQRRIRFGKMEEAQGSWRRIGEGGIVFSRDFLPVRGDEPSPDGTTFCEMRKTLGIFPSLYLHQGNTLWYGKQDRNAKSIPGVYKGDRDGTPSELVLHEDHTFSQSVTVAGALLHSDGTWQSKGKTVAFSREFLKPSGVALGEDETAATAEGTLGPDLQIDVSTASKVAQPVFR